MGRQTGCYAAWWCGAGGMAGGPASRSLTRFKPPAAARRKGRPVGLVRAAVNSEVRRAGQDYDEDGAGETGCEGAEGRGSGLGWVLTLVGFPFLEGQHLPTNKNPPHRKRGNPEFNCHHSVKLYQNFRHQNERNLDFQGLKNRKTCGTLTRSSIIGCKAPKANIL